MRRDGTQASSVWTAGRIAERRGRAWLCAGRVVRFPRTALVTALTVSAGLTAATPLAAQSANELVSQNRFGTSAEGTSSGPALSQDGRFVTFYSDANDLVSGDRNGRRDVFVLDRKNGSVERISRGWNGSEANGRSQSDGSAPSISDSGRYVAFSSRASNLVPDDGNDQEDVFVYDRQLEETVRVSVGTDGEADGASSAPRLSSSGRFVAFQSFASNLVDADTNGAVDIFVFDREFVFDPERPTAQPTRRVSVSSAGSQAGGPSFTPAISGNGGVVAFTSAASNLVGGDTNGFNDVFVYDIDRGDTVRASVGPNGRQSNGSSFLPDLTFDGNTVAFKSDASNLVPSDANGRTDVFVRNLVAGTTERASVDSFGNEADGLSGGPRISRDGRYVVFPSFASNFDPIDRNGAADLFVFDREAVREDGTFGEIRRASVEPGSVPRPAGNVSELPPAISADGRRIAFGSQAENLVPNDINNVSDVFLTCNPFDPTGCAPAPPCVGDCNGDGSVDIDELMRMVAIALEIIVCRNDPVEACLAGDASCNCKITIDEIVRAVANALSGCSDFAACSLDELADRCLTETPCEIEP